MKSDVIVTRETQSATKRMEGARRQKDRAFEERIYLLGLVASFYPGSHLAESKRYQRNGADKGWRYVLCVHTDEGALSWHLPDEESDRLSFLTVQPNDSKPVTRDAKLALLDLAMRARASALRKTT